MYCADDLFQKVTETVKKKTAAECGMFDRMEAARVSLHTM